MHQPRTSAKPDPHDRLRKMKIAVLSTTGALLATISWLVAGHAVGSTSSEATAPGYAISSVPSNDHDGDDFFGGGSALSNGVFEQRVMRSSGS
jgi:hypothetical protein